MLKRHALIIATTVVVLIAAPVVAADLLVGPAQTYTTIQAAVDAAAATGDIIHIGGRDLRRAGSRSTARTTIRGAGAGSTIIESPASSRSSTPPATTTIPWSASRTPRSTWPT